MLHDTSNLTFICVFSLVLLQLLVQDIRFYTVLLFIQFPLRNLRLTKGSVYVLRTHPRHSL